MTTPKASVERKPSFQCKVCGTEITRQSRTGMCRKHANEANNADPVARRKRAEGLRRFVRENPEKASAQARKAAASRVSNPEQLERLRAQMRAIQHLSYTPEAMARRDMKARGAKVTAYRLAWCPEAYRPLYIRIRKGQGFTKAEAMEMVLNQIKADEADNAKLSPFERQERALNSGARIVANDRHDIHSPAVAELRAKLG